MGTSFQLEIEMTHSSAHAGFGTHFAKLVVMIVITVGDGSSCSVTNDFQGFHALE
jgi:hypothetical protein